jgi:LPXTG-motif cell wall-anchored protein
VKVSSRNTNRSNRASQKTALRRTLDPLLPALLAIGGAAGLMAKPASAVELGQLQIDSTLGQPLSASIAYALNPHEELYSYCITLKRGVDTGVQHLTRARIKIVGNRIVLTGARPINEPMLAMRVAVNCPYTVKLNRDYMVMINPAGTVTAVAPGELSLPEVRSPGARVAPAIASQSQAVVATRPGQPRAATTRASDESPVYTGSDYRVQTGDTLSKIANRIDSRPVGLWPAIEAIYVANPDAFVANDKNRLMAGSLLTIPTMQDYDVVADVVEEPAPVAAPEEESAYTAEPTSSYEAYDSNSDAQWAEEDLAEDDSYLPYAADTDILNDSTLAVPTDSEPVTVDDATYEDDTDILTSGNIEPIVAAEPVVDTTVVDSAEDGEFDAAKAGDVFAGTDSQVEASAETEIPETAAVTDSQVIEDAAPARTIPVARPLDSATGESVPWLAWAGGGALALILGLLFAFRRRLGGLFGGDSAERVEPLLEDDDEITQESHVLSDVDFPLDDIAVEDHSMELDADLGDGVGFDATATPEISFAETTELDAAIAATVEPASSMELDADLGAGTGLTDGTDLDVAQDFGFSATGENAVPMDLELPVEVEVEDEELPTDIIPPHLAEEKTILDAEVPPVDNDDDSQYDLSMIVDATKQALGDVDATTKDLNAVQLDAGQRNVDDSAYTLSKEVDFKILEQDYEEELTQTQAVNEEIARAAMELTQRMEVKDVEDVLDVTAEMPAREKKAAQNDDDATALNPELTIDEEITVRVDMDADDDTVDTKNLG